MLTRKIVLVNSGVGGVVGRGQSRVPHLPSLLVGARQLAWTLVVFALNDSLHKVRHI